MKKLFTTVAIGLLISGSLASCQKSKEDYKDKYHELIIKELDVWLEDLKLEKEVVKAGFDIDEIRNEAKENAKETYDEYNTKMEEVRSEIRAIKEAKSHED